jgi:hypothetical protein
VVERSGRTHPDAIDDIVANLDALRSPRAPGVGGNLIVRFAVADDDGARTNDRNVLILRESSRTPIQNL